jgi:hypothetical protein
MVEQLIESKLDHGTVVIWSQGDHCAQTGKKTRKAKKLLRECGIEFSEIDLMNLSC